MSQGQASGRILALDVGKKRIGLAMTDELGITAQGLPTFHRTRVREDIRKLCELIAQSGVTLLVVGRPLHLSGSESRQSEYTREFAERLAAQSQTPLEFWDERLTSAEAERLMRDAGASLEQRKAAVDQMAAILILDAYMQHRGI